MSMPVIDMPTAVWVIVKVSVLMVAAAIAHALLRRPTSAATRHLVWTLAIAGLLLLPMLSAVLPAWRVAVPLATSNVPDAAPIREPMEPTTLTARQPAEKGADASSLAVATIAGLGGGMALLIVSARRRGGMLDAEATPGQRATYWARYRRRGWRGRHV